MSRGGWQFSGEILGGNSRGKFSGEIPGEICLRGIVRGGGGNVRGECSGGDRSSLDPDKQLMYHNN